jgi:hypothetical protein
LTGDSDFVATGDELLGLARAHGGLSAASRVLDVGCWQRPRGAHADRRARPAAGGGYVGFDPVGPAVAWCAARYPAPFRFVHADLRNDLYNPGGAVAATGYRFPVDDGWASLVVATSVFTHLDRPRSTATWPRPGARWRRGRGALLTFFLLDDDSRAALAAGRARQPFADATGEQAVADPEVTMAAGGPRARRGARGAREAGPRGGAPCTTGPGAAPLASAIRTSSSRKRRAERQPQRAGERAHGADGHQCSAMRWTA